jgi:hypothetical protein
MKNEKRFFHSGLWDYAKQLVNQPDGEYMCFLSFNSPENPLKPGETAQRASGISVSAVTIQ